MAELTPEGAALIAQLDALVRRGRWQGAARGLALGALPGAGVAAMGAVAPGVLLAGFGAALGAMRAPGRAAWARRLDAWGGLADACACALDHARRDTAMHRAQARRALAAAQACTPTEVAPRPSIFWAVPVVALGVALVTTPAPAPDGAAESTSADAGRASGRSPAAPSGLSESTRAATPSVAAPATGAPGLASTAPEAEDGTAGEPPEPGTPGSRADPPEGSEGKAAGVGARAGELGGGRLRPSDADALPTGPARSLPVSRGTGVLAADAGAGAPFGGLPTARDDAFSDPARALPPGDAPLVAAYFDRRRPPAPASHVNGSAP
jgi:hypothetical protein